MRIMLDVNVLLDCLVLEANGQARVGKAASDQVLRLCDHGVHDGMLAWHTLPIVAYYHGRQNPAYVTASVMDDLLTMLEVPTVGHGDAVNWRAFGMADFEDALQVVSALCGNADVFITRNTSDFIGCPISVMTPEEFLIAFP